MPDRLEIDIDKLRSEIDRISRGFNGALCGKGPDVIGVRKPFGKTVYIALVATTDPEEFGGLNLTRECIRFVRESEAADA